MVTYEWTAEAVDEYDDIQDNAFADTFFDIKSSLAAAVSEPGMKVRIGLVRNRWSDFDGDLEDRQWAYIENDKLPDHFQNTSGNDESVVPKRFMKEMLKK